MMRMTRIVHVDPPPDPGGGGGGAAAPPPPAFRFGPEGAGAQGQVWGAAEPGDAAAQAPALAAFVGGFGADDEPPYDSGDEDSLHVEQRVVDYPGDVELDDDDTDADAGHGDGDDDVIIKNPAAGGGAAAEWGHAVAAAAPPAADDANAAAAAAVEAMRWRLRWTWHRPGVAPRRPPPYSVNPLQRRPRAQLSRA